MRKHLIRVIHEQQKSLFLLLFIIVAGTNTLFADPIKIDGICYEFNDETLTAEVVSGRSIKYYYSDNVGNVAIPETVTYSLKTYTVTSIEAQAFAACSIKSVSIPKTVISIGNRAMTELNYLESITVADENPNYCSVDGVLFDKDKRSLIAFPRENIKFRDNLTYNIPSTVTRIEDYVFKSCNLVNVSIPKYVEYIGVHAFSYCTNITTLSIGNNIKTICKFAFSNCSGLTSIYIPDTNILLGDSVFFGCSGLTSVRLSNNISAIGDGAFRGCSSLTSISIPNSVKSIGKQAFWNCKKMESVSIGNQVDTIHDHAFYNCTALTTVNLPNSVKYLGRQVFVKTAITQPLYNNTIFARLPKSYNGAYTIPNGIETIAQNAFQSCNLVTSITLPNTIIFIGERAFDQCYSLTSVNIPDNITFIPDGSFTYCQNLSYIDLPKSITNIGSEAFYGCSGLFSVTCRAINPPMLGTNVFTDVKASSCVLYVPYTSIELYRSADQWKDFGSILPISAQETETIEMTTTTTENSVDVTWPSVTGAATYELVIKDKDGKVICTLTFNSNGQLTSIAINAPSRDGAPQRTQTAGFSFTITGLDSGTSYDLTITSKDAIGQIIEEQTISFTTEANIPTGFEDVQSDQAPTTKALRDGQVYILRNNNTYDIQGKKVK